jgi:O-antigen/teichoic acid export membrane protein
LWIVAGPLASLLHEPSFALHFVLFACDIPLFMLGQAYRNILMGRGRFALRTLTGLSRWLSRLAFTVIAALAGISIVAAIATCIGASIVELIVGRWALGSLSISGIDNTAPLRRLAASLMISTLSVAIIGRMDLLLIKILGWPAEQAGFYAAAQNLALIPGLFGQAISGVLLSTLTRISAGKDVEMFSKITQQSMTASLCLVPVAGVVAGGAADIAAACFGITFEPAADFLPLLFLAATAQVFFGLLMAPLIARGRANMTAVIAGPLVFIAAAGHLWAIPIWGPVGAAWTTAITMLVGAGAAYVTVQKLFLARLSFSSLVRAVTLGCIGWAAMVNTPPDPLWRLICITSLSLFLAAMFARQESLISMNIFSAWRHAWLGEHQA